MRLPRLLATPLTLTWCVLLAIFAVGACRYAGFASVGLVRNLLVNNAFLGVAAVGATFVIVSGGIDLSVGSVMALTSIALACLIEQAHVHPIIAILLVVAGGTLFGAGQGLLIARLELPAFLVTLAGLFLARGLAFTVRSESLGIRHPFIAQTLNETAAIPLPGAPPLTSTVLVMLVVLSGAWVVLRHTRLGRAVYAIGDDDHAAGLMGLPVAATRWRVYAVSGGLSALAGVLFVLFQQSGDPAACKGMELDAIAAVVIGGTLLRGGVGSVLGSFAGVLILGLIQEIISFEGTLSSWWARIVTGALVLAFLCVHGAMSRLLRSARVE